MNLLGIDYGEKKVGLAIATASFAEPIRVIKYKSVDDLFYDLREVIRAYQIKKIIVGISDGKIADKTKDFVSELKKRFDLSVVTIDEVLTTKDAQRLSIEAGIKRSKRKSLEDAYSAALILQRWLDRER